MEKLELKKNKVYLGLKQDIISGKFPSGSKLPRETELAIKLGVGRITLRASLEQLENNGFIKRIHGKGTFVYPEGATSTAATVMVIHNDESGFQASWHYIVPEISRYVSEKHLKAFVTTTAAISMFSESDIRNFVKSRNIIGIIAVMNNFIGNEPILAKMKSAGIPTVITHGWMKDAEVTGLPCISVVEKEGWETAIAYLSGLGHRQIAIIGSSTSGFRGHSMKGTLQLLEKYHARPDESIVCTAGFSLPEISRKVKTFLSGRVKPTAILCFSDFYAIYVYDALKGLNLHIPDDVAVMGTCGYPDAQLLNPPLSTIDYGYAGFAEMAVEMIQEPDKWSDPDTGKGKLRLKPFKLIKRQSTEPG